MASLLQAQVNIFHRQGQNVTRIRTVKSILAIQDRILGALWMVLVVIKRGHANVYLIKSSLEKLSRISLRDLDGVFCKRLFN